MIEVAKGKKRNGADMRREVVSGGPSSAVKVCREIVRGPKDAERRVGGQRIHRAEVEARSTEPVVPVPRDIPRSAVLPRGAGRSP